MIGGDVGDGRHATTRKPVPGIIIVQIRNAPRILAAAAEFADIVAERSSAYKRKVDGKPRFCRQTRHVDRHIVHANGVGSRIKRHDVAPDAHERGKAGFTYRAAKRGVFRRNSTFSLFLLGKLKDIR